MGAGGPKGKNERLGRGGAAGEKRVGAFSVSPGRQRGNQGRRDEPGD